MFTVRRHVKLNARTPKILVVDDDKALTQALSIRLSQANFQVHSVTSADQAAEIVFKVQPDLILLDINMEGYSGLEFHECLRITDRGRKIPVVYLSGQDNPIHRESAAEQQAAGYLLKPYDSATVIRLIREVLGNRAEGLGICVPVERSTRPN